MSEEITPIICCDKFKEHFDNDSGPFVTKDYDMISRDPNLDKINLKWMSSCWPECGPNFAYEPIDFCPFCGEKLKFGK